MPGQGALGRGLDSGQEGGMYVGGMAVFHPLGGLFATSRPYTVTYSFGFTLSVSLLQV